MRPNNVLSILSLPLIASAAAISRPETSVADTSNSTTAYTLPLGTDAIAPHDIPTLFKRGPVAQDTVAESTIQQTLTLYSFSLDGKNFEGLDHVFAENAVANYSDPIGVLSGVSSIKTALEKATDPTRTQHFIGVLFIHIFERQDAAFTVSYFDATQWGIGDAEGEFIQNWGHYQDTWNRFDDGTWKIVHRNVVFLGPIITETTTWPTGLTH